MAADMKLATGITWICWLKENLLSMVTPKYFADVTSLIEEYTSGHLIPNSVYTTKTELYTSISAGIGDLSYSTTL